MNWIADFLTRTRNTIVLKKTTVIIRGTKTVLCILKIMKEQGFIKGFEVMPTKLKQSYVVHLKYIDRASSIRGLKFFSKKNKTYIKCNEIYPYLKKFSCPMISTSKGIMSGKQAIENGLGGKMLCEVF